MQLRVTPLGKVELLSTHDQMLGGPSGQSYFGCIFPADPAYAAPSRAMPPKSASSSATPASSAGSRSILSSRAHDAAPWQTYAIEINLRRAERLILSDPSISHRRALRSESATFITPNGRKKFLVASDHVESPRYRGFTPDDLFDLVVRRGLHFGQVRQTGVVFHMLSALGSAGRLGLTAVGDSPEEARRSSKKHKPSSMKRPASINFEISDFWSVTK